MSASTVSITANTTTTARRRTAVVPAPEKKTDLIAAVDSSAAVAANGRDLSNNLSAEPRSSREAVQQVKKAAVASTISPPTTARRGRKAAAAVAPAPKPMWQTVLSVLGKNLGVMILLIGLVQGVRWAALRSGGGDGGGGAASWELEGRIAEVEKLVKNTAKMIQIQVEVVDRKIEGEVGALREEVGKRIDERSGLVERKLEELEEKSAGLERNLGELKGLNWMSKEEFEIILKDLKEKMKVGGGNGEEASLNDIRAYARDVVMKEIEKHAGDGLGRVDYALSSGGAAVVKHSDPYMAGKIGNWLPMIASKEGVRNYAQKMLKPSFGEPGQCFPLKGSSGFVQIKLRKAIVPEAVTLEHVAKSVAYDRSSAPKDCRVSGWLQDTEQTHEAEKMYLLTEFTYDLEKSNAQTFNVLDSSSGSGIIDTVRFDFTSNHGSPSHTCIYRLRVHGHEPDSVSVIPIQS